MSQTINSKTLHEINNITNSMVAREAEIEKLKGFINAHEKQQLADDKKLQQLIANALQA